WRRHHLEPGYADASATAGVEGKILSHIGCRVADPMAYPHLDSRPGDDPPAGLVRAELDRILASELFTRSERLSAFLKFTVEETLAGRGDSLKEQVIAVELYGKAADFNTAADPIVRVDARRLRDRLREYYATAPERGVVISVPKGSYTPAFHLRPSGV